MSKGDWLIATTIICMLLGFLTWAFLEIRCASKSYRVTGTVVEKFRTEAGYKRSAQPHVVIFSDSLRRNVDIRVTWNCYANMEVGKKVAFNLRKADLNQ